MKPVEIYEFVHLGNSILVTSYDEDVIYKGNTYKPQSIKRSDVEDTQDAGRRSITIDISLHSDLVSIFQRASPVESVQIKIIRLNQGVNMAQSAFVLFTGTVEMPVWGSSSVKLTCQPSLSKAKTSGLRCKFSAPCNHSQYSTNCGLDFDAHARNFNVLSVSGAGYEIEINLNGHTESLFGATVKGPNGWGTVSSQHGSKLSLFRPVPGLAAGEVLKVAPSCGQDWNVCRDTFRNIGNCLAFVDIPRKNPYAGDGLKGNV